MIVRSTNIGKARAITWNGEEKLTGIFKKSVPEGIHLLPEGVAHDFIGNKNVHGGSDKACYIFGANHYPFWKSQYPELEWDWGMFGENITLEELNEAQLFIGSEYTLGKAKVQVMLPREPCFKLGLKFKDQGIIAAFANSDFPGVYLKILESGIVKSGDKMELLSQPDLKLSIRDFYQLMYRRSSDPDLLNKAINHPLIPERKKKLFRNEKGA